MTTKRKTTLLGVIIFGALAFLPFMSGPHGPIPIWEVYVILPLSMRAGYWADFCLASGIVIVLHVGLSVGLAALISQSSRGKATMLEESNAALHQTVALRHRLVNSEATEGLASMIRVP
jgi:hypothetical protein